MNKIAITFIGLLIILISLFTLTLSSGFTASGSALYYTVTIIGDEDLMDPQAINDAGEVSGIYDGPTGDDRAFRWSNGSLTDLGTIGGYESTGYGIGPTGEVAGCSIDEDDFTLVPIRWEGTSAIELDPEGCAYDVNSNDESVGWLSVSHQHGFSGQPVVWDGTEASLLPKPVDDLRGEARAINEAGDVVGYSQEWVCPCTLKAMHWSGGGYTVLPTLGGTHARAWAINDDGIIVGEAQDASQTYYAVMWEDGTATNLGVPGSAIAVNNDGDILISGQGGLFLWDNGVLLDLEFSITDPGWEVEAVIDLNDSGQILAIAYFEDDDLDYAVVMEPCLNCGPTPTPTSSPTPVLLDFEITGMEITQGVQNLDNEMPLVKDRLTWVRVYLQETVLNDGNIKVSARLHAYANGNELPNSPILAINNNASPVPVDGGSRLKVPDSMVFQLPPGWTTGTLEFTADVNFDNAHPEIEFSNNTLTEEVTFHVADELNLIMVPMHLHDNSVVGNPEVTYFFDQNLPEAMKVVNTIKRYHPVAKINMWPEAPELFPPNHASGQEWDLEDDAQGSAALNAIKEYNLFTLDPAPETYYVGMVDEVIDVGGLGYRPGNESYSKMKASNGSYPYWYWIGGVHMAHELSHNKGVQHKLCSGDEASPDPNYPWPHPNCQLAAVDPNGYYGFDVYNALWSTSWTIWAGAPGVISNNPSAPTFNRAYPMMGYEWPRWISPYEYCELLPTYGIPCTLSWPPPPTETDRAGYKTVVRLNPRGQLDREVLDNLMNANSYLVASGVISPTAGTATLDRVYKLEEVFPDALQQAARQAGYYSEITGTYELVQLDGADQVLASHPILGEVGDSEYLGFLEVTPFMPGAVKIQVRDGAAVLDERAASAAPPSVTLLSPNGGETLTSGSTISWTANDADGDPLTFNLLYSKDNGGTWQALILGVEGSSYTLTSLKGIPGSDNALLRVMANDGFYTAQDDSDAVFNTPKADPLAVIVTPEDGLQADPATLVLFGLGTDQEDGPLAGASLSWSSDIDGDLGTGEEIWYPALSTGWHNLTLTATDSDGQTGSMTVRVLVGYQAHLPAILKGE